MKYRNKVTGAVVEVMPGTRLPKVYEKVESNSATVKKSSDKPATAAPTKKVAKNSKTDADKI